MEEKEKKESFENKISIKNKKIIVISVVCVAIIFLIILFCTIFSLINIGNNKILNGISINGIDVAKLTKQEAIDKINNIISEDNSKEIILKKDEFEQNILISQLEPKYEIEKAVENAYKIGRDGNIIENNFKILSTRYNNININIESLYKEEEISKIIEEINGKIPNAVVNNSYFIEDSNLIITRGKEGNSIIKEEIIKKIKERIDNIGNVNNIIEIPTETIKPEEIDIKKIYEEVHKEAKDAYYTTNPFTLYPHVDGVDFSISIEEAENLIKEDKEEYVIPLKITKPNITTEKIGTEAFPDLLGTFSTKYDISNTSRSTNLALAGKKINGTVVMPGETFSYNAVVGERTIAAGYKEAKIYQSGKVVDGLGGGICQISSTLYNSVVYANLEIVSRRNHQFITSYVSAGRDATVVYGSTDFKFKNTRQYPIKVKCIVKNGIAKVDIYGIKEEKEYTVDIKTTINETIPYNTTYVDDSSMKQGEEVVTQKGTNGYKSTTYKIVYFNGNIVSKTVLSNDKYNSMERTVKRGAANTVTTTAEPVQEEVVEQTEQQNSNQQEAVNNTVAENVVNNKNEENQNTSNNQQTAVNGVSNI